MFFSFVYKHDYTLNWTNKPTKKSTTNSQRVIAKHQNMKITWTWKATICMVYKNLENN